VVTVVVDAGVRGDDRSLEAYNNSFDGTLPSGLTTLTMLQYVMSCVDVTAQHVRVTP
jgi:hypothetical protein